MDKPKVGIVYHFFAHYRSAIIHELIEHGQFHYLFVGDVADPLKSGIEACPIEKRRFIPTRSRFFGRFLVQAGVIRLALSRELDVIIYLGDAQFLTTWISAALARLAGKRVIFWSHGWPRLESGLKDWLRCWFYRLANGMVLYGNRSKAIGVSKGFDPRTLHVIYNSLNYGKQKNLRNQIRDEEVIKLRQELFKKIDTPVVICTGRLVGYRRLDLVIEALGRLNDEGHAVNLVLVGEGPEHANLAELARRKGLEQAVVFFGACYDERKLATLIRASNVTVIPGQVGLTAMHSLAYGVPVIAHDNPDDQGPEWEAIVPGVTGDYYQYGNVRDLARKIYAWTYNTTTRQNFRSACFAVIEKYYNPVYQRKVMDQAVAGAPAQDEEWKKWMPLVA